MIERIKENIIAATISAAMIAVAVGIWSLVSGGELVRLLGGATATDLTTLSGRVTGVESRQGQGATAADLTTLSGRVTGVESRQGQGATAADLTTLSGRVTGVESRQGQGATAADLTTLSDRVSGVESRQGQGATAADLTTLSDRVSGVENRQDDLEQVPLMLIPKVAIQKTEKTFKNDGSWGKWSDDGVYCEQNEYVCGLNQKVERHIGSKDDTAMNAVKFYCCSFPQLAIGTQANTQ